MDSEVSIHYPTSCMKGITKTILVDITLCEFDQGSEEANLICNPGSSWEFEKLLLLIGTRMIEPDRIVLHNLYKTVYSVKIDRCKTVLVVEGFKWTSDYLTMLNRYETVKLFLNCKLLMLNEFIMNLLLRVH